MAARKTAFVVKPPAAGKVGAPATKKTAVVTRPVRMTDVFVKQPVRDRFPAVVARLLPRNKLTVPVAPSAVPTDAQTFESPDGAQRYVLPRYGLVFDKVGAVEEPGIAIADRSGTPALVVTLKETPSPAPAAGAGELQHVLGVTLRYRLKDISGLEIVQSIAFTSVLVDETGTIVTAELPLAAPGQRQQIVSALGSRDASATLVVGRGITVGVPAGELSDGAPGYRVRKILLEWEVPPAPLVVSERQRDRLGGGAGGAPMLPLKRHRIASHSYWQDPVWPNHFYFLPDRFLLARAAGEGHRPLLRVSGAARIGDDTPRLSLEFQMQPVIDPGRIDAARAQLVEASKARGGSNAIALEILPDPQPLLRLQLPENGEWSSNLTERPGAEIDLEQGLSHVETMRVEDFQLVYEAFFGASLSLLHDGSVRAVAKGGEPEDIPLELRIDKTVGNVLDATPVGDSAEGPLRYRLTNGIESPVVVDRLTASVTVGDTRFPLQLQGLTAGQRLAPGQSVDILLATEGVPPIPRPIPRESMVFDQSHVTVEADPKAIWKLVLNRSADAQITRQISVEAVPILFGSAEQRPEERVAAFVVTVERGGSVSLTELQLVQKTTVAVPIEPLITGSPMPPIRYRTETFWGSGAVGVSAWRETDGTILMPIKTAPPPMPVGTP